MARIRERKKKRETEEVSAEEKKKERLRELDDMEVANRYIEIEPEDEYWDYVDASIFDNVFPLSVGEIGLDSFIKPIAIVGAAVMIFFGVGSMLSSKEATEKIGDAIGTMEMIKDSVKDPSSIEGLSEEEKKEAEEIKSILSEIGLE